MISIFYTRFYSPIESKRFLSLLELVPGEIRYKVSKFRKWEDAHACLLGKCLLIHAIAQERKSLAISDLQFTEYGRPYFNDINDFDFNISHSGNIVVCAVTAEGKVGIDLEEIKHINVSDYKNQFSDKEWLRIENEQFPHHTFYDYWTKKEAVLKADGRGVSLNLQHIDVSNTGKVVLDNKSWFLKKIDYFNNYSCNVSSNVMQSNYCFQFVDFEQ